MGKPPREGMADVYAGGRPYIASLAHTVFEGMAMGDSICRRIAEDGAAALAELTYVAARHFDDVFPVVMTGGILRSYPEYAQMVCERSSPKAKMIMSTAPPVYGAVVEAMWQCGRQADEETARCFAEDYDRMIK
jgi:N-acetylglucosamine kinase-like BadF-type ATPase